MTSLLPSSCKHTVQIYTVMLKGPVLYIQTLGWLFTGLCLDKLEIYEAKVIIRLCFITVFSGYLM